MPSRSHRLIAPRSLLKGALMLLVALFIVHQFGMTIYLNLRDSDPILPGFEEYDADKFAARTEAGETMLVEIYASWCPTCYAQHQAFEQLVKSQTLPPIRAIRVDFDRDSAFRMAHDIRYTGTLLLFKGGNILAEGRGLTEPDAILAFLQAHQMIE